jgi:hypothetical protein
LLPDLHGGPRGLPTLHGTLAESLGCALALVGKLALGSVITVVLLHLAHQSSTNGGVTAIFQPGVGKKIAWGRRKMLVS